MVVQLEHTVSMFQSAFNNMCKIYSQHYITCCFADIQVNELRLWITCHYTVKGFYL